jgi:hypothetical protein
LTLRDRKICFVFSARKQQILRYAQDDTSGSSCSTVAEAAPLQNRVVKRFENDRVVKQFENDLDERKKGLEK